MKRYGFFIMSRAQNVISQSHAQFSKEGIDSDLRFEGKKRNAYASAIWCLIPFYRIKKIIDFNFAQKVKIMIKIILKNLLIFSEFIIWS